LEILEWETVMVTTRHRTPIYDDTGRITGSVNRDTDLGPGSGNAKRPGANLGASNVGHMDAGAGSKLQGLQKPGRAVSPFEFNGPTDPNRRTVKVRKDHGPTGPPDPRPRGGDG